MRFEIVDVGYGGAGVARTPQGVVFIPGAFTGEVVEAELTVRKKHFAQAKLLDVLQPSPERIVPEATPVPGMVYASLDYNAEIRLKQRQLETLLTRIGKFQALPFLLPPVPSPKALHYRNKLVLHWSGTTLGYIGEDNRTVLDTPACPLSQVPINDALSSVRADRKLLRQLPPASRVGFRFTPHDGVILGAPTFPKRMLTERVAGLTLRVAADAFFQINLACAELLLERFREALRRHPAPCVCDFYCGCGLFGFVASQAGAKEIYGFETTPSAVRSAQQNAQELGIHALYRCAPSENFPETLPDAGWWIVDPPRDGLSNAFKLRLRKHQPNRLAYISCGPDTLARDLASLKDLYAIDSLQLFDFFPRTAHFETLCLLSKR